MKGLIIFCFMTLTACAQLAPVKPLPPDEIKNRVAKLLQAQRAKVDWMSMTACPTDRMPQKGRRPNMNANVCSSGPEICLEKCDTGDGEACYFLANLIQEHDKIESDVAEVLNQRSCELGIVSGCTNRASSIFERGRKEDEQCVASTFERACSQEDAWGCTMYGFVLSEGIGREKNIASAVSFLVRACDISIDKAGPACKRAEELRELITRSQKP